jgi:hypothetical protein
VGGTGSKEWEESMTDEIDSLVKNSTWELVDRLKDRDAPSERWVYRHKQGAKNEVILHTSRYMIRGFELLFALAAAYDLKIEQMDVKTAFLYGEIDVDIYMEQPEGFCSKGKA